MKSVISQSIFLLLLAAASLNASDNGATGEKGAATLGRSSEREGDGNRCVGERGIAHADFVAIQENRAAMERENLAKIASLSTAESSTSDDGLVVKSAPSGEELLSKALYSSHEGAFHRPVNITAGGDMITLEDGSIWKVRPDDKAKTLDWLAGDSIFILLNHSWFSSYHYVLSNQNTGSEVCVNLMLPPLYNGNYSHWIVAVDYYNLEVALDDGSIWKISSSDYSTIEKWKVNDTIIIGVNDSWFSSKPNILINVYTNSNAAGVCLN